MKLLPLLLLLGAALPAQSYYYSPDNDPTSGAGTNAIPFGTGSATWANQRGQFLVRSQYLPRKPGLVRSLGFAPGAGGLFLYRAVAIRLGHNTTGSLVGNFASNIQGPALTVFNEYGFSWPVTANTWCRIPLARPFVYNGTDNLVVDIVALGSDLSSKGVSFRVGNEPRAYNYNFTPRADLKPFGQGCLGSGMKTPAAELLCLPWIGSQLFDLGLAEGPAGAPVFLFVGASNASWAGLPLPWDLGPLGATGCRLQVSIHSILGTVADTLGKARVPLGIPGDPALQGRSVFFQWLLADAAANPAGLTASGGLEALLDRIDPGSASTSTNAGLKIELEIL